MACCCKTTTTTTVTTVERCSCAPDFKWGGEPKRLGLGRAAGHVPTPYCSGVGCMLDVHKHPGLVVRDLEHGHELGKHGLAALFPIGSEWYYGPIYENMETRIRVTEGPKHSGAGKSLLRDYARPDSPASWFIYGEVVSSPWHKPGYKSGWPPATLIPAAVVERERGIVRCCACDTSSLEQRLAQAQREIEGLRRGLAEAEDLAARERSVRQQAQRTLSEVRKAINS